MKKYFLKTLSLIALCGSVHIAEARSWDEQICSMSMNGSLTPGQTFRLGVSVSAQRTTGVNIPVQIYLSNTPNLSGAHTLLASKSVYLHASGSMCSSVNNIDITLPNRSPNMSCFMPRTAYIVARTGNHTRQMGFSPTGSKNLPRLNDFSPKAGRANSLIHIEGTNINTNTSVSLGQQGLPQTLLNNELIAVVNNASKTGTLVLKDNTTNFCPPPYSAGKEPFTVLSDLNYCESGAENPGVGRISQVAFNGFNNDLTNATDCPTYNNFTSSHYGLTEQEKADNTLFFKLNGCGLQAYDRLLKIYVDWNQDGDFADQDEYLFGAQYIGVDQLYQLKWPVPNHAKLGTTRLRIISALYYKGRVDKLDDVQACGRYPFGETQDYALDIAKSKGTATATVSTLNTNFNGVAVKQLLDETGKPIRVKPTGETIN